MVIILFVSSVLMHTLQQKAAPYVLWIKLSLWIKQWCIKSIDSSRTLNQTLSCGFLLLRSSFWIHSVILSFREKCKKKPENDPPASTKGTFAPYINLCMTACQADLSYHLRVTLNHWKKPNSFVAGHGSSAHLTTNQTAFVLKISLNLLESSENWPVNLKIHLPGGGHFCISI